MAWKIIIILALNVLFYARTLRYNYVSDDIPVHRNPPAFRNKWHKMFLWVIGAMKINPPLDHLLTLSIHALIGVFIYLAFGANNISFLAALLFSFNPVNTQGSIWISGRGYTLPTLLLLISITMPFLAIFSLLACSWFTVGFLAPIALIGSNKAYLLLLMPVVWYIHSRKFKQAVLTKVEQETFTEDETFHPRKLILAIKTVGFYFTLALIPFRISFYHPFLQSCAGNTIMKKRAYSLCKFFWIGLIAILGWVIYSITNWNMISWGMFWFFVCIAPFSNLRRVNQEISERFVYLANAGLMLALAGVVIHYPMAIMLFLTMYLVRTWFIMPMYTDDYWLMEYAVIESPGAWYAWHIRGHKRWGSQSYREALTMWVMAKLISPKEFKVLFNIAIVLKILKNDKESAHFLKLAEENIVAGQEKQARAVIEDFKKGNYPLLV
jgi:hypothetical protein